MEIRINSKAKIFLKEGTRATQEFGSIFWGYIKDLTKSSLRNACLLLVQDSFGEQSLIPCEDVEIIVYE